jgi:hypothetical protein
MQVHEYRITAENKYRTITAPLSVNVSTASINTYVVKRGQYTAVAYRRGCLGVQPPPPPEFLGFDKAEPNSQFHGK